MPTIPSSRGAPQLTDIVSENAFSMIGTASRADTNDVLTNVDSELAKLFIDKNIQLNDGGTLSYATGSPSTLTLTTTLKLTLNSTIAGGVVTKTISGTSFNFSANGRMLYVILDNRTTDSTLSGVNVVSDASSLPTVTSSNQEVYLIAKRVDGAVERVYLRNGQSLANGDSVALGSASFSAGSVLNNAVITADASVANATVASGQTIFRPFMTVSSGHTYTINGRLVTLGTLTVDGTLTVSGTSYVLNIN